MSNKTNWTEIGEIWVGVRPQATYYMRDQGLGFLTFFYYDFKCVNFE